MDAAKFKSAVETAIDLNDGYKAVLQKLNGLTESAEKQIAILEDCLLKLRGLKNDIASAVASIKQE